MNLSIKDYIRQSNRVFTTLLVQSRIAVSGVVSTVHVRRVRVYASASPASVALLCVRCGLHNLAVADPHYHMAFASMSPLRMLLLGTAGTLLLMAVDD